MMLITSALLASGIPTRAWATGPSPSVDVKLVFADGKRETICGTRKDEATLPAQLPALLGELGAAYKLNLFALPPVPKSAGMGAPSSVEGKAAAWIAAWPLVRDRSSVGLRQDQQDALTDISGDLSDYLVWLAANPSGQSYRLPTDTTLPPLTSVPADQILARRAALLKAFLAPLLTSDATSAPALSCVWAPSVAAKPAKPDDEAYGEGGGQIEIAVRGKIDDLATPRDTGSTAFKAASGATAAFTDDYVKGQTTVAIDATFGVGITPTRADSILAFVHYSQSTTETWRAGNDDDSKDIRALSPGIFYRHGTSLDLGPAKIYGVLGVVAYPTFDFAQHARTGRIRLMLDDLDLSRPGHGPLCGRTAEWSGIGITCRAQVFIEGAHVWRAGTSTDLKTLDDDQYLGLGGDVTLGLALPEVDALKPFSLTAEYRYMAIVSGALADPHRLSLGLAYKLPDANLSFGVAYDVGANFDTFQRERITKVTVGYKY